MTTATQLARYMGVTSQAVRAACKRLVARGKLKPREHSLWLLSAPEARKVRQSMRKGRLM